MSRTRVAIIFGGRSSEHAISCATAAGVMSAIDSDRFEVVPIGIARSGAWVIGPEDTESLKLAPGYLPEVTDQERPTAMLGFGPQSGQVMVASGTEAQRVLGGVDVVLPLLHGPFGEDGTLQGMLELADLPYVGSGVLASAAGMDKYAMKMMLAGAGLPVGRFTLIGRREWERDRAACLDAVWPLGPVVFVKPSRAGSSMGVQRVVLADGEAALIAAIEEARRHDPRVIVEAAVDGREIEVAVLEGRGTNPPRTTAPGEIVVSGEHTFYDFEAKYTDTSTTSLQVPASVSDEAQREARAMAARAFEVLDCEGLARVDMFLAGTKLSINEVNTMPGFTPFSMFPMLWQHEGMSYSELITELIDLALERPTGLR
ncbi:D-alanine--D-alanine ligase family protein [Serinibacter salmoneus]|uniref:D-alanine--D-alanine ligase n=1 Tax=Serinibacter salmoneus TaxID=556530 RepID=A0A2A9D0D4_9MICO|nr:D-alanine--D-alanine ligase family protein [Serinibacter salmoneus]PFG20147.1 D-alanine--D-alanine ligase [Serinibacter salmoneus]